MTFRAAATRSWLTARGALRVPQITIAFWVVKGLSTALGEAASDYLVNAMVPQLAVALGFVGFALALLLQFATGRYLAWTYWLAVVMVGVFGTMAADVMHVAVGVPYPVTTAVYALMLAVVFFAWRRVEHTLSIHAVDTARRELFYWATVVATFAMGTALGDLTAFTLRLGYLASAALFAGMMLIPVLGRTLLRWNGVFAFWLAYVITRPLGASLADALGKPASASGLGLGDGPVALALAAAITLIVAYLAITKADVQRPPAQPATPSERVGADR